MKVSDDQHYLAAGCEDGSVILYKIQYIDQTHEILDTIQSHCFKVMDLVFIKKPRKMKEEKEKSDDEDSKSSSSGDNLDLVQSRNLLMGMKSAVLNSKSTVVDLFNDDSEDEYEVED